MLNFFSNGELPGGAEGPFASRDVTSFYEIWQAAQQIEATCLMQNGRPGWAAEGTLSFQHFFVISGSRNTEVACIRADYSLGGREAVGVFLWATDSLENQRVPQGEPTLDAATGLLGSSFNLSSGARGSLLNEPLDARSYRNED